MIGVGIDVTNAVRRPISVSSTGDPDVSSFSITGSASAATEGNSGAKTFAFTITRTGGLTYAAAVDWAVSGNGSNPANAADFVGGAFPSGTANFAANAATATINVQVQGDTTVEPDEGFIVTLSNPRTTGAIGTGTGTSTILNDDTSSGPALSGLVAMGDSWSSVYGQWLDTWASNNSTIPFNRFAAGGWEIATLQTHVADVAALNPAVVSILIGLNDLNRDGPTTWLNNLKSLLTNLRAAIPGVKIMVATVPASTASAYPNMNAYRAIVNPQIRSGVGTWVDAVFPLGDYILDTDPGDGVNDSTLYLNGSPPGHPTTVLQGFMGKIWAAAIDPFFANVSSSNPSAFTFTDRPGATAGSPYKAFTQNPITGMSFGHGATAVGTGAGMFQADRNGVSDTSPKTVFNGDWPAATVTASATVSPPTAVNETVTIGTTADTFTATTGPVASDTFTRANGALGTTEVGGLAYSGPALIASNKVVLGQNAHAWGAFDPGLSDFDISLDVTVPSNAATLGSPWLLFWGLPTGTYNADGRTNFSKFYYVDIRNGQVGYKFSNGGLFGSSLTNNTFTPVAVGATYTVRVVGKLAAGTMDVYINGTHQVQCTLPTGDVNFAPPAGATWIGFVDESNNPGSLVDNLSIAAG